MRKGVAKVPRAGAAQAHSHRTHLREKMGEEGEREGNFRRGALFPSSSSSFGRASDALKRGGRARNSTPTTTIRMLLCCCLRAKASCVCVCVCLVRQVQDGSPTGSNSVIAVQLLGTVSGGGAQKALEEIGVLHEHLWPSK